MKLLTKPIIDLSIQLNDDFNKKYKFNAEIINDDLMFLEKILNENKDDLTLQDLSLVYSYYHDGAVVSRIVGDNDALILNVYYHSIQMDEFVKEIAIATKIIIEIERINKKRPITELIFVDEWTGIDMWAVKKIIEKDTAGTLNIKFLEDK